jgi:hypothetical protein
MNQHSSIKRRESLLERASELYDFNAGDPGAGYAGSALGGAPVVRVKPGRPRRLGETPSKDAARPEARKSRFLFRSRTRAGGRGYRLARLRWRIRAIADIFSP